jgi:hypothetical protein
MFLGISGGRAVSPPKQTPCTVLDWFRAIQPSRADYYCPKRDARNASRGRPRSAVSGRGVRQGAAGELYLAYLRDPDGNKLCALYRKPAA